MKPIEKVDLIALAGGQGVLKRVAQGKLKRRLQAEMRHVL